MAGSKEVSPVVREAVRLGCVVKSVQSLRTERGRLVCYDRAGHRYIFTGKAWIRRSG